MKIHCLDKYRDVAKQCYRTNQDEYVVTCLGKPLEKLSSFFDGVERLLASGVKAEQVGIYRDFSKAELQKCIQAYPGKEVCYLIYMYIVHVSVHMNNFHVQCTCACACKHKL